jgi:hypothetical protein
MIGDGDCGEIGGMKIAGETEVLGEKTCSSSTLSTTNPTLLDPGLNPGRRGGIPATNRLSYGAALFHVTPNNENAYRWDIEQNTRDTHFT